MSHPEIVNQANRVARKMEEEVHYGLNLRIALSLHASPGVLDTIEHLLDLAKDDRSGSCKEQAAK